LEHPGGLVYKNSPKGFWVVCLKTLNHEFDGSVVLDSRVSGVFNDKAKSNLPYWPRRNRSCRRQ